MRTLAIVATILLLAGCGVMRWDKPGTTQEEFLKDRYACLQQVNTQQMFQASPISCTALNMGVITDVTCR